MRTARRDSLDLVNEDETHLILDSLLDEGLGHLLQQADHLHSGDEQEKREGFQLLLNNKLAVKVAFFYFPAMICDLAKQLGKRKSCFLVGSSPVQWLGQFPVAPFLRSSLEQAEGQNCSGCSSRQFQLLPDLELHSSSCHLLP